MDTHPSPRSHPSEDKMEQILHRKWKLADAKGRVQQTPQELGSQIPWDPYVTRKWSQTNYFQVPS